MYEEKSGVNEAVVEENLVQAADEQGDDVVTIADLMGDEPAETADAQDEQGEQQEEDAPEAEDGVTDQPEPEPRHNNARERENNAFAKRLAAEKRKMEADPVYKLGRELAARYGGDAAKAMTEMRKQQAQELAQDPVKLAEYMLNQRDNVVPEHEPEETAGALYETDQQKANRIVADLRNVLGDGADLRSYIEADPDFMQNCDEFGAAAAVKMANRARAAAAKNQTIATKLAKNRSLPQPIRPTNNAQTKAPDFSQMSDRDFAAFEAKVKKAQMDGKKVKLE